MSNPTWPSSVPAPLFENVNYSSEPNIIRTQMDAGVAKVRRRFTSAPEIVTFRMLCTPAQVQTLSDFAAITLKDVLPFDWREFRKPNDPDTLVTYRFRERPKFSPAGPNLWYADIELDLLTTFQGTFLLDIEGITT